MCDGDSVAVYELFIVAPIVRREFYCRLYIVCCCFKCVTGIVLLVNLVFVVAPIVVLQPSCRGCVTRSVLLGLDCCCCSICLTGMGLLFIYWLLLLPLSEWDYFFNLLFVVATIVCWGGDVLGHYFMSFVGLQPYC